MSSVEVIGSISLSELKAGSIDDSVIDEFASSSISRDRLLGIDETYKEYDIKIENNEGESGIYAESMTIRASRHVARNGCYYMMQLNINAVDGMKYIIPDCIDYVGIMANNASIELEGECDDYYIYRNGATNFRLKISTSENINMQFMDDDSIEGWIDVEANSSKEFSFFKLSSTERNSHFKEATNGIVHTGVVDNRISSAFSRLVLGKGVIMMNCKIPVVMSHQLYDLLDKKGIEYSSSVGITIDYYEIYINEGEATCDIDDFIPVFLQSEFREDMYNYLVSHLDNHKTYIGVL